MGKKLVKDLMISKVRTVEENANVFEVAKMMSQHNIGAVVIMSAIQEAVGIFTERDLLKRVVAQGIDPRSTSVSKVMTPKFVCVQMNDEVGGLSAIMVEHNFRHLPVVEGRKVVGILSMRDLLKTSV
jgi:CBS domain-containing protein